MKRTFSFSFACGIVLLTIFSAMSSFADEPISTLPDPTVEKIDFQSHADRILIITAIVAALTLALHIGLSMYEGGLTRAKFFRDSIIRKVMTFGVVVVAFVLIGYAIKGEPMNPATSGASEIAAHTLPAKLLPQSFDWSYLQKHDQIILCDLIVAALWCATAVTIVTGAMAERVKLGAFLIFAALFATLAYPILHMWASETSWLGMLEGTSGFRDLGATTLHSVGGWMALAGAMVLGARLNKFKNGKVRALPGHNLMLAAAGIVLIWLGWLGTLAGYFSSFEKFALLAVNFSVSGLTAMLAAAGATLFVYKKADFSISLSGFLGGLVASTGMIHPIYNAVAIGLIAGLLVVWAIGFLEKIKLDDPIGAIPIHLVCGIWGSLVVGILGEEASLKQFLYQLTGVIAYGALAFGFAFIVFTILKSLKRLRVSEEEELERGLELNAEEPEAAPATIPTTETH